MVTEKDLLEALEECAHLPANYQTCEKMATFYTLLDHLTASVAVAKSAATTEETIGQYGETEFLLAVANKAPADVWPIMGELMDALQVLNPRLYSCTMAKLK